MCVRWTVDKYSKTDVVDYLAVLTITPLAIPSMTPLSMYTSFMLVLCYGLKNL